MKMFTDIVTPLIWIYCRYPELYLHS